MTCLSRSPLSPTPKASPGPGIIVNKHGAFFLRMTNFINAIELKDHSTKMTFEDDFKYI